jgi:hypothetical protein
VKCLVLQVPIVKTHTLTLTHRLGCEDLNADNTGACGGVAAAAVVCVSRLDELQY